MKTILQITSADGKPLCGHIVNAPDAYSLAQSVEQVPKSYVGCTVKELASEDEIVSAPPPKIDLSKMPVMK